MNFLLNRGGAGKSLTRAETAEELSSLMTTQITLLRTYEALIALMDSGSSSAETLAALQKEHRNEIPKISEIILSAGGIPPRKADRLEGDGRESLIRAVCDGERGLRREIDTQLENKHHLRTIGILESLAETVEDRIGVLQKIAQEYSVPVA